MSSVVGIDLSSKAIDLVKLDEESNRAEWVRVHLAGKDAWERTLTIREQVLLGPTRSWFDDVYLVAIEEPYSAGQPGTLAILNRVVGAIMASLPVRLRNPAQCWHVRPKEWRLGHGWKGNAKPTTADIAAVAPGYIMAGAIPGEVSDADLQNARDAYCIALYAREENARGVTAALQGAA